MSIAVANVAAFLETIYGRCDASHGGLIFVNPDRRSAHSRHSLGSPADIIEAAEAIAGTPGTYFKVNLMDVPAMDARSPSAVGGSAEVTTVTALVADIDTSPAKEGYMDRWGALEALQCMPEAPTLVVNTDGENGGLHAYWALRDPVRIRDDDHRRELTQQSEAWQSRLRWLCGGKLDATANLDRMLRVPGVRRSADGPYLTAARFDPELLYDITNLVVPAQDSLWDNGQENPEVLQGFTPTPNAAPVAAGTTSPIDMFIQLNGVTREGLLREAGYRPLNDRGEWIRPGSQSGGKSLTERDPAGGISVWTGDDPNFPQPRYYNLTAMLVQLRYAGDWSAARRDCGMKLFEHQT